MDDKRYYRALQTVAERSKNHDVPDNATVIVAIQKQEGSTRMPSMKEYEAYVVALDAAERTAVSDSEDGDNAPDDAAVLIILLRRSRFSELTLALAPATSELFAASIEGTTVRHQPALVSAKPSDSECFTDLVRLIVVTYAEQAPECKLQLEALALSMLALGFKTPPARRSPKRANGDAVVASILREIAARPESVTLADLAERYSYNQNYLSGLLRERCGKTFSELVVEQRMERAKLLLTTTALPVTDIARLVGYTGTSNFYQHFKAQFGMTPAELRQG